MAHLLHKVDGLIRGEHDHGDMRSDGADAAEEVVAARSLHHDVREDEIDLGLRADELERLRGA